MKKNTIVFISVLLSALMLFGLMLLSGCGTGATGGGGGGGGSPSNPFTADIYVSVDGSDEYPDGDGSLSKPFKTISKGLSSAEAGKVVGVLKGVYSEGQVIWPNNASKEVTLRGVSKDLATFEGSFRIGPTFSGNVHITIESITMRNYDDSASSAGGAMFINVGSNDIVHVKDAIIYGNTAQDGGGIYNASSTLVLENCVIQGNRATHVTSGNGGGIGNASTAIIENCTFDGNIANNGSGGGIYNTGTGATCVIDNSTIKNNYAAGGGGGLYNDSNTSSVVNACTLSSNSAEAGGGGVMVETGSIFYAAGTTFNDNSGRAGGQGGAIYIGNSTATLEGCMFNNNTGYAGGALYINSAAIDVDITSCTFEDNSTPNYGGAIVDRADNVELKKSYFVTNSASGGDGGAIYMFNTGVMEIENCVFYKNACGTSQSGGAISSYGTIPSTIVNCTFVSNEASSGCVSAVYFCHCGYILNSIIYNNNTANELNCGDTATIEHSAVDPSHVNVNFVRSNCTSEAPIFAASPLLALDAICPASITTGGTNEGTMATAPNEDILDNSRPWNDGKYSMGAYEKD